MKKGLILEGGAMLGMFTCGVLDVLMENGVEFDGAIGVSAGAAFGCNYKSRQIGRAIRYNVKYCRDKRFCSLRSLFSTGDLFGAEFCYRTMPQKLDVFDMETFLANPMEFYSVATDLNTGKAVYHKCSDGGENDLDNIRASASLPILSRPVKIGKKLMLDGGLADPIPIKYFESIGYDRNVAVLTRPLGFRSSKNIFLPFMRAALRKYPKFLASCENQHKVYNETLEYLLKKEKRGEIIVIRPRKALTVGHIEHDPRALKKAYREGRLVGKQRLAEIKRFLEK